jgi:hypothetical protein
MCLVAASMGISVLPASLQGLSLKRLKFMPLREPNAQTASWLVKRTDDRSALPRQFFRAALRYHPTAVQGTSDRRHENEEEAIELRSYRRSRGSRSSLLLNPILEELPLMDSNPWPRADGFLKRLVGGIHAQIRCESKIVGSAPCVSRFRAFQLALIQRPHLPLKWVQAG